MDSASSPLDHGTLSGIRRHNTPKQQRTWENGIEKTIDRALADIKATREAEAAEARKAYAEANKAVPFTPEELKTARAIRTTSGWHRVSKVNAKSVSVETGHSWTDRYTLDKILEVR